MSTAFNASPPRRRAGMLMHDDKARYLRLLLKETARRQMAATVMYEPMPEQERFHRSPAAERLAVGGNRGSKTTCCAMEVAWAVTGTHPYLHYPKENGRFICVAQDADKIALVMYRKLFRRDMWMKKDPDTGRYRAWRPWIDGYDERGLVRAMPLIPPELLDTSRASGGIAWERRGKQIPRAVYFKNGWEINFYSGDGRPPRGVDVDGAWFDEELEAPGWYPEISARLIDRRGKFIWSATPESGTEDLWHLHERAQREACLPEPTIEEFHFVLSNNPYINPRAVEEFKVKMAHDPEIYAQKVEGQFRIAGERVYTRFNRSQHCITPFPVPDSWTRYIGIDPSWLNTAILFFACPPPDQPQHLYVYDEAYFHQKNVTEIAEKLKTKIGGQYIEEFFIDAHGGRRTEMGGKSITTQFYEAFEKFQIRSLSRGSRLTPVGDDGYIGHSPKEDGIEQVRGWLYPLPALDGKPKLQVFDAYCPVFIGEMQKYRYKKVKGRVTNKTDDLNSHGPDVLRYAATYRGRGIEYVKPKRTLRTLTGAALAMLKARREDRKSHGNFINIGPGG